MHAQKLQPLKNTGILDLAEQEYEDSQEAIGILIGLQKDEMKQNKITDIEKQTLERYEKCKNTLKVGQQKINRSLVRDTINAVNESIRQAKSKGDTEKVQRLKELMKEYQNVKKRLLKDRIRGKNINQLIHQR